jgi:hypothetical protein
MIHSSTLATRPLAPPLSRATADIPIQARVEIARHKPRGDGPLPLVSLMADRLLHHTRGLAEGATEADLRADGFTAAEIDTYGEAAREIAAAREASRLARHGDNFGA